MKIFFALVLLITSFNLVFAQKDHTLSKAETSTCLNLCSKVVTKDEFKHFTSLCNTGCAIIKHPDFVSVSSFTMTYTDSLKEEHAINISGAKFTRELFLLINNCKIGDRFYFSVIPNISKKGSREKYIIDFKIMIIDAPKF